MRAREEVTLFLCGDVMTGRGIDQVLPHPSHARIYEPIVTSALDYVHLAERAHGPIPRPVDPAHPWGDALELLEAVRPDVRIVNLETSITTSEAAEPKGINYRMHPENVEVLTAAGVDCCVLANNHVLDWGEAGLIETLETLECAGIAVAGAGRDLRRARAAAVPGVPGGARKVAGGREGAAGSGADGGRVLVFALGAGDSGIPGSWAAGTARPGVYRIAHFSDRAVDDVAHAVEAAKRPGDVAVASVHWGGNWGYEIPAEHRRFAHALIDRAGIDLVHGHSSHHPKAIEVHRERPILYGCGDFLNDYEGIGGYDAFRGDLVLMYFATLEVRTGRLVRLELRPLRIRGFRLHHAAAADRAWLRELLDRECGRFGHRIVPRDDALLLTWG